MKPFLKLAADLFNSSSVPLERLQLLHGCSLLAFVIKKSGFSIYLYDLFYTVSLLNPLTLLYLYFVKIISSYYTMPCYQNLWESPPTSCFPVSFFFFFLFLFFFIIFFYCSGFCHTLKWNSHGFTCVPHPDPPSHLPLHPIPLGLPSAPGPSACLMHPTWAGDLFHPR